MVNDKTGEEMLVGPCTRDAFLTGTFQSWYRKEYGVYIEDMNRKALDSLKGKLNDISITAVIGTWCSDSKREFPHFMRILDYLTFPDERLKIICLDHNKLSLAGESDSLNIILIPTIIFYRRGSEIGRIIEIPLESLERDMRAIILKEEE